MYQASSSVRAYALSAVLVLASVGTLAEEDQVTLDLEDVGISALSLALTKQTHFRYGIPPEVQKFSGLTLRAEQASLSEIFKMLEDGYGLCAWIWQPPNGYEGPNLYEIRWASCGDTAPKRFVNFVPWDE